MPMSDDGATEIARRARGTPRIAGRLLRRVRDFAIGRRRRESSTGKDRRRGAVTRLEVDALGLDSSSTGATSP
jgi:Holliday junction DNA helicase RuvB